MLDATDAARIADHYALGADAVLSGRLHAVKSGRCGG